MGLDPERFEGEVDEELLCPVCHEVLEDPLQVPACEHAFCRACITEWLSQQQTINQQQTCPIDRQPIQTQQLKPVPHILRTLLARLQISCSYKEHGCSAIVKLELLAAHTEECEHKPKRPIPCEACGLVVLKEKLEEHNCVRELRSLISGLKGKMSDMEQELTETKNNINDQKMVLQRLKDRSMQWEW